MDIDAALAELEQHEVALTAKQPEDDDDGLSHALADVFANVEQQQRLDAGRKTLEIKSFA